MAQPIQLESKPSGREQPPAQRESEMAFAFTPPLDVIATKDSILIEMILPGVERSDIVLERIDQMLVIRGVRKDEHTQSGGSYHHVETPRGHFFRAIPVPFAIDKDPPLELERGVLRIRLAIPESNGAQETK